ncbi:MAG: hypothetical protein V5A79_07215 [Candidatus Bipolaricaulota bacterium]|nr:hypothetical protein [Candidatus Bipolaricaulota bacterium]
MEVEFRVMTGHLSRVDPEIEPAIDKLTSAFWPFGRRKRARKKLEEKQNHLLDRYGIEKHSNPDFTVLKVTGVETEEEAREVIDSFKEDLEQLYRDELDFDPSPIKIVMKIS